MVLKPNKQNVFEGTAPFCIINWPRNGGGYIAPFSSDTKDKVEWNCFLGYSGHLLPSRLFSGRDLKHVYIDKKIILVYFLNLRLDERCSNVHIWNYCHLFNSFLSSQDLKTPLTYTLDVLVSTLSLLIVSSLTVSHD